MLTAMNYNAAGDLTEPRDRFLKILPEPARAKMLSLYAQRDDAAAALQAMMAIRLEFVDKKQDLENRRRIHGEQTRRGIVHYGEPPVADSPLDGSIDYIIDRLKHHDETMQLRQIKSTAIGGLLANNLEPWLATFLPFNGVLPAAQQPSIKLQANAFEQVEGVRRRIRERVADLAEIRAAPIPSTDAKKLAREQIIKLADRGRPDCFRLIELGEPIEWPTFREANRGDFSWGPDGLALVAWLHKDALLTAIGMEIDSSADDKRALSSEARREKSETALRDILTYEREEEFLIDASEKAGSHGILRRPDADPRAVFGLAGDLPGPER